jgi:hypothetical protein
MRSLALTLAKAALRGVVSKLEAEASLTGAQQQDVTSFVLGAALDRARDIVTAERIAPYPQAACADSSVPSITTHTCEPG